MCDAEWNGVGHNGAVELLGLLESAFTRLPFAFVSQVYTLNLTAQGANLAGYSSVVVFTDDSMCLVN